MKSDITENVFLYDWVTVSCKSDDPKIFIDLTGLQAANWEPMEHGRNGYRQGYFFQSITILYDGMPGMGVCMDMSGQGCRAYEEYGTGDFDGFFDAILSRPDFFHLSRLDVAFDDHTGILDIEQLFHDCDAQEYVSKFKQAKIEKQFTDGQTGITVYHGSKKSDILFRIYDKAAERGKPESMHWVRVEMQLRNERALAFIGRAESIGVTFAGVLLNYLRYVDELAGDSNRWRWPMKKYWSDLVGAAEKISLYVKPGLEYNIMQLDNYVFGQAANAIDAALQIHGIDGFIFHLRRREVTSNPKYERLIEQYKRKKTEQKL